MLSNQPLNWSRVVCAGVSDNVIGRAGVRIQTLFVVHYFHLQTAVLVSSLKLMNPE